MYKPNFKGTNEIVNHIAEISATRELILNAPILPQWEVKLRKKAEGHVCLDDRQMAILKHRQTNARLMGSEGQSMFSVSREMANRLLRPLL